jgi:hypothetical protein
MRWRMNYPPVSNKSWLWRFREAPTSTSWMEPLVSLDNESGQAAIELILELTAGKGVILIMHGYQEYYKFFDAVRVIYSIPPFKTTNFALARSSNTGPSFSQQPFQKPPEIPRLRTAETNYFAA